MTQTAIIIRIDANGPNGLEKWEQMDYASLVSGEPVQRGHLYHEIEDQGYMVGVWDCTSFTDQMMPYPVDEYMLFLEGDLTMVLPDGREVQINAGDAFIIPKGLNCQWKQNGFVHKFFMILDGPVPEADNASLTRISVPNLKAEQGATTLTTTHTEFLNATGTMKVEVQACSAMSQPRKICDANLLITVLEGALTLNDGNSAQVFSKGETCYIRQGGHVDWATADNTRLIIASYVEPA